MEIHGTRFGSLEFDERDIIHINDGLLGFPLSKKFIMFPYADDSAFFWLQSANEADIAFIVVNPFDFFSDLEFTISDEDAAALAIEEKEDLEIFTLVTIPDGHPEDMRTNMAGPVIVNVSNRQGRQVLMKEYSPRQPLIPGELKGTFREQLEAKQAANMMMNMRKAG
ncbi:flagellar assembly protein FliW [Magnetococcales bacterium HHB-1]